MNNTQLKSLLTKEQIVPGVVQLCKQLSLTYGLKPVSPEFAAIFAGVLKKYFGYMTFDDINNAFEYHAQGYLNVDVKVKFSVQELTKILRAWSVKQKLNNDEETKNDEPDIETKHDINNQWCDQLEAIFNKYMNDFERSHITLPWYTCDVLAKIGLLDRKKIDYTEKTINIRFKDARQNRRNNNENLIYQSFDAILDKGETLAKYLNAYRNRYVSSEVMPF